MAMKCVAQMPDHAGESAGCARLIEEIDGGEARQKADDAGDDHQPPIHARSRDR
jgi:hypothetical protein